MRFARRILSAAGIAAVKNVLKHDTTIAVERDRFDAEPSALNCMGDFYNLRTGETRPCTPGDMFSKTTRCKAAALEKATGKKAREGNVWELPDLPKEFWDFLEKVTSKNGAHRYDLTYYILSYFGYCLTGETGASFFVNFHGEGANGKSELLGLMFELFGDYAAPLPTDVVIENQFQSQFDLAGLPGIRLGVLIDAPDGHLNMKQLKPLVSGDAQNGKRKYLEDFTFNPVCKIAVASNHKLKLRNTGLADKRRIRMVPFDYTVPEEEMISHIHRRLLEKEGPEILALLIWFAHEYYAYGEGPKAFPACAAVDETSAEYLKSQDLVGRWIEERTDPLAGSDESSDDLYKDFRKWAGEEGVVKVMSKNTFGEYLAVRNPEKKRKDSKWYYCGIRLKPEPAKPPGGG
jgi:putative DNA primase/helicase